MPVFDPYHLDVYDKLSKSATSIEDLEDIVEGLITRQTVLPSRPTRQQKAIIKLVCEHPVTTPALFKRMFEKLNSGYNFYLFIAPKIKFDFVTEIYELWLQGDRKAELFIKGLFTDSATTVFHKPVVYRFISWYDSKNILETKLADMPRDMIPDMLGFNTKD
jgi:hypothetical protein